MKTKYLHVTHNDNSGYHSSQLTFRTLAGSPAECLWPAAGRTHASCRLEEQAGGAEGGREGEGVEPTRPFRREREIKKTLHTGCMYVYLSQRAGCLACLAAVTGHGDAARGPSEVIGHDLVPGVDVYVRRRDTVDRGGRAAHHARGAAPHGTLGTRQITPLLPLLSYV